MILPFLFLIVERTSPSVTILNIAEIEAESIREENSIVMDVMGPRISERGIKPNKAKVEAITKIPEEPEES